MLLRQEKYKKLIKRKKMDAIQKGLEPSHITMRIWQGPLLLVSRAQDNHGLWDITSKELAPGDYELTVTDQGYDSYNNQINITASDRSEKFYITIEASNQAPSITSSSTASAIDENTAILVSGNEFEVLGQSYVMVYDGTHWDQTKGEFVKNEAHQERFHVLRKGGKYNMKERKVGKPLQK